MKTLITLLLLSLSLSVHALPTEWNGWPARAYNYTTSQYEMMPQCFAEVTTSFFKYNDHITNWIHGLANQESCKTARAVDFRF
jgi:hypothetical protein